jgi:hypothetical protein
MPVTGFLNSLGNNDRPNLRDAFRRGFEEMGFVEGRNIAIVYRYAENQVDRLPPLAGNLPGDYRFFPTNTRASVEMPSPSGIGVNECSSCTP